MILAIVEYFFLCCAVIAAAAAIANWLLKTPAYRGPLSDHFDGKRFYNYGPIVRSPVPEGVAQPTLLTWLFSRPKNNWKQERMPTSKPKDRITGDEVVVTYINHTTVLLQTENLNIITDPIWATRASPVPFFGPKRYQNPGVALADLPPIDLVLLSHNHYDHLDLRALRTISARWNPKIITTLGTGQFLKRKGIKNVAELDWWEAITFSAQLTLECVPAQHFASRSLTDRNTSLWAGFVVKLPRGAIYFAGDTGYGPFVEKIRAQYPDGFMLGLLPIGAYKPAWFMETVHISPQQAFRMHQELRIVTSIATHWGTFRLADDGQYEPQQEIATLVEATLEGNDFRTLKNGAHTTI